MKYYICFVGGSGARCCTAMAHSLFAGCFANEKLNVLLVDADTGSQDTAKASAAMFRYRDLADPFRDIAKSKNDPKDFLTTQVDFSVWNPSIPGVSKVTNFVNGNPNVDMLVNALFTQEQQNIDYTKGGFHSNPNLGACFLNDCLKQAGTPYSTYKNQINVDLGVDDVKLIMVGSLFGGTGASSFPVIVQDIRNSIAPGAGHQLYVAAVMLTPYFYPKDLKTNVGISVDEFLASTKEALAYYAKHITTQFDAYYLLGSTPQRRVNFIQDGGAIAQHNPCSLVEAEAAQACLHFFLNDINYTSGNIHYKTKSADFSLDGDPAPKQLESSWNDFGITDYIPDNNKPNRTIVEYQRKYAHGLALSLQILFTFAPGVEIWQHSEKTPPVYINVLKPYYDQYTNVHFTMLWEMAREFVLDFKEMLEDDITLEQRYVDMNEFTKLISVIPNSPAEINKDRAFKTEINSFYNNKALRNMLLDDSTNEKLVAPSKIMNKIISVTGHGTNVIAKYKEFLDALYKVC